MTNERQNVASYVGKSRDTRCGSSVCVCVCFNSRLSIEFSDPQKRKPGAIYDHDRVTAPTSYTIVLYRAHLYHHEDGDRNLQELQVRSIGGGEQFTLN